MSILSGTVQEPLTGIFIGATNLSEFALQAPLGTPPAGMTFGGTDNASAPKVFEIIDDGAEGRAFRMSGQATFQDRFLATLDFADGDYWPGVPKMQFLARLHVGTTVEARFAQGVGFLMDGVLAATLDHEGVQIQKNANGTATVFIASMINGASSTTGSGVVPGFTIAADQYMWIRYQRSDTGGANRFKKLKAWVGTLAAEPAAWLVEETSGPPTDESGLRMGVFMPQQISPLITTNGQKISFFSFTTDFDQAATPGPDDILVPGVIVAPTVTVDPIQADWVALSGTPFTVA